MTISPFMIYLISIADNLQNLMEIIALLGGLVMGALIFKYYYDIGDYEEKEIKEKKLIFGKKCIKISIIVFISSLFIGFFSPSTKTIISMYTIPSIINNQEVQKLPDNLLKFANDYLTKEENKHD